MMPLAYFLPQRAQRIEREADLAETLNLMLISEHLLKGYVSG
jgi:hypothetical protein